MRTEMLNQVVKENPMKATAEQRLPYGEGEGAVGTASCPTLTVPFPLGSRPMFKENRLAQYSEAVGLSGTSFYKLITRKYLRMSEDSSYL